MTQTFDQKFYDSTLSFYVNQLDVMDKILYQPLTSVTWSRDIKLRSNIGFGNESTSFMRSSFSGQGTQSVAGKPWISAETTALPGVSVNGERIVSLIRPLGREISYTSIELARSQTIGVPIDVQKIDALNELYQLSTDEMVYIGDSGLGVGGLVNNAAVTAANVTGAVWPFKTPAEILSDVNTLLTASWTASAYKYAPTDLRLPPAEFAYISTQLVSTAGNVSILEYITRNNISTGINNATLNIQPLKWLTGRGAGSTNRMMCYTNAEDKVRFPMVPIRRETPYYQGIHFCAPYIWAYGELEIVYPETIRYADGI
jgi:hypothetical protein